MTRLFLLAVLCFSTFALFSQQSSPLDMITNYSRLKENDQVISEGRRLLATFTTDNSQLRTKTYLFMIDAYSAKGEHQEAIKICQEALTWNKSSLELLERLAQQYFAVQNDANVVRILERAVVSSADAGDDLLPVYSLFGQVYERNAYYYHAIVAYATALTYAPYASDVWYRLGYCYEQVGSKKEAQHAYTKALRLRSGQYEDARLGLSRVKK